MYQPEWKVGTLMCSVGHAGVLVAEMKLPQYLGCRMAAEEAEEPCWLISDFP